MCRQSIVITEGLRQKLNEIRDRTDIANQILNYEVDTCKDTYINYLGISEDNPHFLSYLNKDRINRISAEQYWDKNKRYHTKTGKIVEMLFPDTYSDRDKELFTDFFRNSVRKECSDIKCIKFFEGEDIRKYYLEDSYAKGSFGSEDGSLWASCMRYDKCQEYLDIYCQNTDKIGLAVIFNTNKKVKARAIVWYPYGKDGATVWYDRIYAIDEDLRQEMQACLDAMGFINISPKNPIQAPHVDRSISIKYSEFDYYPYADTLCYLNRNSGKLANYSLGDIELQNTDGTFEGEESEECCDACGEACDDRNYIERGSHRHENLCDDCSVYSEHYSEHIARREAVMVEFDDTWVLRDDAVKDYNNDWIILNNAVELWNGEYVHEDDDYTCSGDGYNFLEGDDEFVQPIGSWSWYKKTNSDIVNIGGDYYLIETEEYEEAISTQTKLPF